jgi:hypothetical protein
VERQEWRSRRSVATQPERERKDTIKSSQTKKNVRWSDCLLMLSSLQSTRHPSPSFSPITPEMASSIGDTTAECESSSLRTLSVH